MDVGDIAVGVTFSVDRATEGGLGAMVGGPSLASPWGKETSFFDVFSFETTFHSATPSTGLSSRNFHP